MRRPLCAFLALLAAAGAQAGTRRVAIVVGNNVGNEPPALHYAENDADKFARVLGELGGVAAEDLFLLEGRDRAAVGAAFDRARRRLEDLRRDPTNRTVVLFYFSGHSDGEALELGGDRIGFAELRRWLAETGADVRVALLDSCKSGALLAAKGGTPGAPFQIRLTDDLASTGEVLLTSSAADEVALESREIGGSFFTHHFISGLRGAADASGDGIVTLSEAYEYAYSHTIKTTGETLVGPQHPAYDYRLSGQGELVLTSLAKPSAALELPGGFDRVLIVELARDQVIAEVAADGHGVIAVQPGSYGIRAWHRGKLAAGRVAVAAGETRLVRAEQLVATEAVTTTAKGAEPAAAPTALFVAAGGEAGVADGLGVVPALRVELSHGAFSLALDAGTTSHAGFRETTTLLLAGYRVGVALGHLSAWAGVEAGAGLVVQSNLDPDAYSGAIAAGALVGGALDVTGGMSIALEGTLPALLLRRDGAAAIVALPAAWLGVRMRL